MADEAEGKTKIVRKKTKGRPSIYDPSNLEQVRKYALLGLTDPEIADLFNVEIKTYEKWKKEIPGFMGTLRAGREEADANVTASLYERACGYSHEAVKIFCPSGQNGEPATPVIVPYTEHFPPDTAAARIWLYNRQRKRWNDVVQNQVNLSGSVDVNLTGISLLLEAAKASAGKPPVDEDPEAG